VAGAAYGGRASSKAWTAASPTGRRGTPPARQGQVPNASHVKKKPIKKAVSIVVDVPADQEEMLAPDVVLQVHDETDAEVVRRGHGWISGKCDCCLTLWAGLGEAVEGGADQIVGLVLLPTSGAAYYFGSTAVSDATGASEEGGASSSLLLPQSLAGAQARLAELMSSSADFALHHPASYLAVNLGGLVLIGLIVLYDADLLHWYNDCRRGGYQQLREGPDTPATALVRGHSEKGTRGFGEARSKPVRMMREATLRRELHKAVDATEELELKLRVKGSLANDRKEEAAVASLEETSDGSAEMGAALRKGQARRDKLQSALISTVTNAGDSPLRARSFIQRDARGCWMRCTESTLAIVFRRSLNGLVTVWLYFADVVSDIEVLLLLLHAHDYTWFSLGCFFLMLQLVLVYCRVLPYLRATCTRWKPIRITQIENIAFILRPPRTIHFCIPLTT
jgi:hypothetical protein